LFWQNKKNIIVEVDPPVYEPEDSTTLPTIVLIHGANQTRLSFEYIRHALPCFQYINIEWNAFGNFYENTEEMINVLDGSGPVYIVGHSMGGIYAAHIAASVDCIGGSTISTPWGGSRAADWIKYLTPSYKLYYDVGTKGAPVLEAQAAALPGRWTNYISTAGNVPGMGDSNDCVLTISSMTKREDIYNVYIDATHYEILMSPKMIHSIGKNILRASEKNENSA